MTRLIISDEAAKALVKAGTVLKTKSVQTVPRIQDSPSQDGIQFALASILWQWTKSSGENIYHANAYLVDSETGIADQTKTVVVYSSSGYRTGASGERELRWIAKIDGHWQLIDTYTDTDTEMTGAEIMNKLQISSAPTVTNVSDTKTSVDIPTAASVTITPTGSIALSLGDSYSSGSIEVVTDIAAQNGVLGVQTRYLSATYTGTAQTVSATLTKSSQSIVTGVSKTTANRVTSITSKEN